MISSGAPKIDQFIEHWSKAQASERANAQPFLCDLADLLGVPRPGNDHTCGYTFEFPVKIPTGPDTTTEGSLDLYRRGSFVLEAKQFVAAKPEPTELALALDPGAGKKKSGPVRDSEAWDDAMWRAKGQAERYVRNLPADEPPAPFLLVVDVGHSIEVFADFTQAGRAYQSFPDPRSFRIRLADLADPAIRERLRRIWLDPLSLDPAKVSAVVTREIAGYLATLASSLEDAGHSPKLVAEFLTRCLFCMFAEDVGLLPKESFRSLLESLRQSPDGFVPKLRQLFAEMQTGTDYSVILNKKLLRFNGGLFEDASVRPLDGTQLGILIKASSMQWKDVEPAIFGTLLERALDPTERHQLGAHYTPRAYVERLVLPTVIEPLRAEWQSVRAAALVHARKGDLQKARAEITRFHTHLCEVTVLDPACGSGNFLYVTLEHLKRLEGEVLDVATGFGENLLLDLATHTVDPHQFLGIEKNERAASVAEMVLWIGYLQWHFRTRGDSMPAEPVLKKFRNIECRDAVLAWDGQPVPARDKRGEILTVWDRRSMKTDLVTGRAVPDETKRVPLLTYPNARPAAWPVADYIVGNPPFLGTARMREDLGDGYAETLRAAYPDVPESADFVMYWWHKAAALARTGAIRRFGLITTNSLRQTFNRRVVEAHLKGAAMSLGGFPAGKNSPNARSDGPNDSSVDPNASPVGPNASPVGPNDSSVGPNASFVGPNGLSVAPNGTPVGDGESRREAPATGKNVPKTASATVGSGNSVPLSLLFAIPDHPWVDTAEGAAVRIAMTVGAAGNHPGELRTSTTETDQADGSSLVTFTVNTGHIAADLTTGADVASAMALKANDALSCPGMKLHGSGFIVTREEAKALGLGSVAGLEKHIREYRNGRDLADSPREVLCIDLFGLTADDVRLRFPAVYQHVLTNVKPERDANQRESYRRNWWIFGEPRRDLRPALAGLPRYIATVETAKHRVFQFLGADVLPDNKLVVIALDDAFHLGVLSSHIHVAWALAQGAMLEDRPVYPKTECFDPFPFPECGEAAKGRIRALGEELDAHRKRVQAQHPGLSLTAMYNVLASLRAGRALSKKEQATHDAGLVSVLRQFHDELDAATAAAYGWPASLSDAEILTRLVALNSERAAEEATGNIRWLRPAYQSPTGQSTQTGLAISTKTTKGTKARTPKKKEPWPKSLAERVAAVERALKSTPAPATAATLAKTFLRAKPEDLAEILETLVTLGRAHRDGERFSL